MPKRLSATLSVTACLFLTLGVFAPSYLYLTNKSEFKLFLPDLLLYTLFPSALLILIATAVIHALKPALNEKIVSLGLALSFLLWLQGNILVWQYGPLTGRPIAWSQYWHLGLIDLLVWAGFLFLAFKKSSFFYKRALTFALALICIQVVSISFTAVKTASAVEDFKYYIADDTAKFHFSTDQNVIVLILDEFQSDCFLDIVQDDQDYASIFDGFVYFPNALAAYNATVLAVPALMTTIQYTNTIPRPRFLKKAFLECSIPKVLKDRGFTVHVFPWLGLANDSVYFDEQVATNFRRAPIPLKQKLDETLRVLDLALLRYVPHFAKKYVYNDHKWLLARYVKRAAKKIRGGGAKTPEFMDLAFVRAAGANTSACIANKVFKFYHLNGPHVPLTVNRDFEYCPDIAYNKKNYEEQARASLKVCRSFLDELKKSQVYDNSLIFVIGDHGGMLSEDMYINPEGEIDRTILNCPEKRNFHFDKARGIPLVLVKRFHTRGPLKTCHAPVSLLDIPSTIMSELNLDGSPYSGMSMFEVSPESDRKRYYGAYTWRPVKSNYVDTIIMYEVSGNSWANESWTLHAIYPPAANPGKK